MIYVIIVNWRGYSDTIECLESLMRIQNETFRVIVVDNESRLEGVKQISDWAAGHTNVDTSAVAWATIPKIRSREPGSCSVYKEGSFGGDAFINVISVKENTGFAGANNIGVRAALGDPACEYIWLLNNDTVVDPHALNQLLGTMRSDINIGICGSTLLYYDTPDIVQSVGGSFNKYVGRGTNIENGTILAELRANYNRVRPPEYIVGASMMVSRKFLDVVGLMDDRYFLYFEELDWAYRNAGRFRFAWATESIIYHKEGGSIGTNSRGRLSDTSLYYFNINFLRFTRRFNSWLLPAAFLKVLGAGLSRWIKGDRAGFLVILEVLSNYVRGRCRKGPICVVASGTGSLRVQED